MRKIESGELAPGAQLSNEPELRYKYNASRNTIQAAIRWLVSRGLVETRVGLGTFVALRIEPIVTTLHDQNRDPEAGMAGGEGVAASSPRVEVKEAPDWVAERLRIFPGDEVIVRHQEFRIGTTPWSLQTTFYPLSLVERGATGLLRPKDIREGTVKYLADTVGLVQCGSRLRVLTRPPNEDEARFFGLPDDGRISVFSLIRTGYEDRPEEGPYPFRVTFTVLPADRNQFVINTGKVPEELAAPARDQ